jgi:hypothetical protein
VKLSWALARDRADLGLQRSSGTTQYAAVKAKPHGRSAVLPMFRALTVAPVGTNQHSDIVTTLTPERGVLGWTFIGWAVALIWACSAVKRNEDDFDRRIRIEKRRNS